MAIDASGIALVRPRGERLSEQYDFSELISNLESIDCWLQKLGLSNPDRIRRYLSNIRRMIEVQKSGGLPELQRTLPFDEAREIFWSYVEAEEFVRAISALRTYDHPDLRTILRSALKGPADLFLEKATTKQARDHLFELIMGGRIAAAGYQPYFNRGADISFNFATLHVDVECKRPLIEAGLEGLIRKGIDQLEQGKSELGIVAVSLSRIIVPGDPGSIPTVPNDEIEAYLDQRFGEIIEPAKRFWESRPSPRLTGVWFYAFVPVRVFPGPPFYIPARLERVVSTAKGAHKGLLEMLVQALNLGEKRQ
jgi:hypothetical protein